LFNLLLIRFSPSNHFIFFLLFLLIILAFCWRTGTCSYNDLWKGYVVMVVLYFHNLNIWWWRLGLLLLLMMMLLEYRGNKVDKVHRCLVLIIVLIRVK
jgi:4-hydroxybenzoate polyprenyltransferase